MARTKTLLATAGLVALCGLTMSMLPGKWKVADGGKQISKRPSGMNWAIITNNGPETVNISSKGLNTTNLAIIPPDGVTYSFNVPANAKNAVIRDEVVGTGAGAKGFLFWAKKSLGNSVGGDPSGTGD